MVGIRRQHWWQTLLGAALVVALTFALYGPFAGNPLVFDDDNLFGNLTVFDYAQQPFSGVPRAFPYFTIGLLQVLSGGDLAWNRGLNVALHLAVVLALYCFLRRASRPFVAPDEARAAAIPAFVCLWVALNPVAVYAVGYLVQRTIVLATLFALVSTTLYLRAQQQARNVDLVSAALLAGLAMMSKEHAILTPVAAVLLTPLCGPWRRAGVARAAAYLALSAPVMVWVVVRLAANIGNPYEIYAVQVLAQFALPPLFDFPGGLWLMSIATQLLLFWKYLALWLLPNPQWMAVDLRVDFPVLWAGGAALAGMLAVALATLALWAGAALVWLRPSATPRGARAAALLLFAAAPFAVELSTVRVQEPFVLYRSYLWLPALALIVCVALLRLDAALARRASMMPRRALWVALALACAALFPAAQDRLRSFSSEAALWQDALEKLPRADVAGADRIYYNLAGEAFKRKDFDAALAYSERVIAQNPDAFHGYLARGSSLLALGRIDAATQAFDTALAHRPPQNFLGYIEFKRCGIAEARGDRAGTIACLRRSARLGYEGARLRLNLAGIAE